MLCASRHYPHFLICYLFLAHFRPPLFPNLSLSQEATMARRSSGGRSAPRAAARPAPSRNPPPQTVNHAPPPAVPASGGGSIFGGIGSTIAQGMAFGGGSAMAHRAVDSIMGPRTIQHETVTSEVAGVAAPAANTNGFSGADACNAHAKSFQDCLNAYGNDISKCQFYMDMLSECKRNSSSMVV